MTSTPTMAVGTQTNKVGNPGLMLTMATIGFAVNFWAWALLSPLGPLFRTTGSLGRISESDVALLVAVLGQNPRWRVDRQIRRTHHFPFGHDLPIRI